MQYSFALFALAAAVQANPVALPQAVTAAISPAAPPPPGCTSAVSGSFGIAVHNVSTSAGASKRQVSTLPDGQIQVKTYGKVSMITDGQIQGSIHTMMVAPIAQIGDGQIQAATTVAPVTQIIDGQAQAPTINPATPASAPSTNPTTPATVASTSATSSPVSVSSGSSSSSSSSASSSVAASSAAAPAPAPSSSSTGPVMVACDAPGELAITLNNGILKDAQGRTGYIASNYQLQFDGPPQAGAIYTSGFTVCGNGTLALGGSGIFYQCLSGNFYNLYDRSWAAQCSPVYINTLMLQQC